MDKKYLKEKIEKACDIFSIENKENLAEFISLFISSYNGIKCSPYAYDYLKNKNPVFFENLRKIFELAGVKIADDYHEREDHIVTLLEFLGYLLDLNIPEIYIKRFFNNYLFWIKEFAQKIETLTQNKSLLEGAKILRGLYEEFNKNN